MRRAGAWAAALALVAAAAGAGIVSVERARDQLTVMEACDAAHDGDVARALSLTEGRTGPDDTGRTAAECRCFALLARGEDGACTALLDPLVGDGGDWVPNPGLAARLVVARRDAGHGADAARLARAAGAAYPHDPALFRLELQTRSATEPEEALLRELEGRLPRDGDAAARMRASLAQRYLRRGDAPSALRVLGADPPADTREALGLWFDTVGIAHAMNDDLPAARATYERWARAGGDAREVRARYALALSFAGLSEPGRDTLDLLRASLAEAQALGDPTLEESLAIRTLFMLASRGRFEEALAVYDSHHDRLPLEGIHRSQIERAWRERELADASPAARRGRLRFAGSPALPDATLWISPDLDAPADTPYEPHPLPSGGRVEVTRTFGTKPQHWVVRDDAGRTLASGTVTPTPGGTRSVEVEPAAAPTAPRSADLRRRPADGRRRVALVLLDCADWRIAGYLRARGELPVFDALLRSGYRAVLDSDPPLTAAALESLVWPERRTDASLAGTFYRFGVELAGLESVGRNPFELLSWVLPESRSLFDTLGAGEHRAANLLLAHGGVRAGRHGRVTGPDGQVRTLALGSTARDLDPAERERFPLLARADDELDAHYVHTMAAEFDATDRLLAEGRVDFVAVRIEPVDILTHAHFAETVEDAQDDGDRLLYDVYRYADARIAALHRHLDADDVLIVMSDHGIRTAMEHSRHAIFVAAGDGVPVGRAPGEPALRGVSRTVADLLAVRTDWPDTGVAAWARALARRSGGPEGSPEATAVRPGVP